MSNEGVTKGIVAKVRSEGSINKHRRSPTFSNWVCSMICVVKPQCCRYTVGESVITMKVELRWYCVVGGVSLIFDQDSWFSKYSEVIVFE